MTTAEVSRPGDRWIPLYFVAFFLVIFCVDAVFVTVAYKTHTGVVTEHPYEEGLVYNTVLQNDRTQQALGWSGIIDYEPGGLSVRLKDKQGHPLAGAMVQVKIVRSVDSRFDQTALLKETEPGTYRAQTTLALPGLWHVRIFTQWNGQTYQQSETLMVEQP